MDIYVSHLSEQAIGMEVEHTSLLGVPRDPTGSDVLVAVMPVGVEPAPSDLEAGTWESDGHRHVACSLRGPSEFAVGGKYRVWAKVVGSPEKPVMRSPDRVVIY